MEDNELVKQAQDGDEEAFNALIHRYSNAVYGTAYQMLGDFHLAQDIAQEVFLKVYRKLKYLRDPAKVGSWLYSMTQRLTIDWIRSNKVSAPLEQAVTSVSSSLDTTKLEVWHAINTLSPLSKLPVILYHIGGYSIKEIASYMGISIEAAESRLRRARQLLRQELVTVIDEDLKANKLDERFEERVKKLIEQHYELSAVGKQLESLSKARKALELDPENRWLKHILAGSLSRCGDVTGDLEYYREAEAIYLQIAPILPSSYYDLGILYTSLSEFDKALECFKRLKSAIPDPAIEMARTYSRKGEHEHAAKLFEETSAHGLGNLCNGLQSLAMENRKLSNKDAGYRCINSLIGVLEAVGPEPGVIGLHWAYCDLAEYQAEDGLKGAAIESIEKAINIASGSSQEGASLLFPRVQFITSRYDERSEIDWIVRDLTSGKCYKELQTMPEYHALVEKAKSLQKVCSTRSENKKSN